MRNFAQELILITAVALGVSVIAAPIPPTPEQIAAITNEVINRRFPSGKVGKSDHAKVPAAHQEILSELEARGFSTDTARAGVIDAMANNEAFRNPCPTKTDGPVFQTDKQKEEEKKLRQELAIDKDKVICDLGAENLAILEQEKLKLVSGKPTPDEKDKPLPNGATGQNDENSKGANDSAQTETPKSNPGSSASGPATPANPSTASSAPPRSATAVGGTVIRSAPQLGPLMGTASKGTIAASGFSGHKGTRAQSSTSPSADPQPNQNLEIVRQALQQKILQREITPAVADTLLSKISPALQKDPDLASALQSTDWNRPSPRSAARFDAVTPPSTVKNATKSGAPKSQELNSSTKSASSKPEEAGAGAAKEAESVWVLNGAANGPSLSDTKKGILGDSLASSIASAIAKKGAPLPTEIGTGVEPDGASYAAANSTSAELASGGLFDTESKADSKPEPADKKQVDQAGGSSGAFTRMIERISHALQGDTRKPASADQAAFEHFQTTESVALASLGQAGEVSVHPRLSAWTPVFFFVTPFTLTIVGFALWRWRWRQRRRA